MDTIKYFSQIELKKLFNAIEKSKFIRSNIPEGKKDKSEGNHLGYSGKLWLRDLCIFKIAYRCGLRASEVGLIKLFNYNNNLGQLYCQRLKNSNNNSIKLDDMNRGIGELSRLLNKYIKEYNIIKT